MDTLIVHLMTTALPDCLSFSR